MSKLISITDTHGDTTTTLYETTKTTARFLVSREKGLRGAEGRGGKGGFTNDEQTGNWKDMLLKWRRFFSLLLSLRMRTARFLLSLSREWFFLH